METLFSLEILIQSVRIEKECDVSADLALGLRLLDFPTLLIYQPQQSSAAIIQGERTFSRGKSCFFKTSLNSLHSQLCSVPLYAMVLDVKEETPKLVGTSLISLARAMHRIKMDVAHHGASSSSYGERGRFSVCSLDGEKIGSIFLSYKLLSLGISLLPHVSEGINTIGVQGTQEAAEVIESAEGLPPRCGNGCSPTVNDNNSVTEDRAEKEAIIEDLTMFCPPSLFFCNTQEEKNKKLQEAHRLLNLDTGSFTSEGSHSEDEAADHVDPNPPVIRAECDDSVLRNQQTQTSGVTSNVLGEALQRLPLLNALLVELSQLNNPNPQQPLPIHPNLAWIYRPASAEPSTERGTGAERIQTEAMQKARPQAGSILKHLYTQRTCSAPVCRTACVRDQNKREQAPAQNKTSTRTRKKLVYGTTRAFHLRLKKVSHLRESHRERAGLTTSKEQPSVERRTIKSSHQTKTPGRKKPAPKQNESLNDDIETAMQSVALGETVILKPRNLWQKDDKKDGCPSGVSDKSASDGDLTVINVDCHTVVGKVTNERRSTVSQTPSSAASGGRSGPGSAFSESSVEDEEADYSDDFNSLHPSDTRSPDPASSPESSRAKTPKSPLRPDICHSDSGSERYRTRPVLPVPIKSSGSPRRSLSATYVIRPRAATSALSFSSDDVEADRSLSSQSRTASRKQRVGTSSGTDSLTSSRGQNTKSPISSKPEPEEAEELTDDLGTLDFRKEYQNISDLLASNLPGYTI